MVSAYDVEYRRALSGDLPSLNAYVSIYEFIKSKDQAKADTLLPAIRKKIAEFAESSGPGSGIDLDPVISLYAATKDYQVQQSLALFVSRSNLSRKQLRNEVAAVLPDLASKMLAKQEILVKIVSDSNDPFIDELPKALGKVDEWITIDDEAKRKLTIARLRITERPGSPIVRTQTLGSPDIATLLFIPKNASVLYDTLSISYEISWSMNVSDSSGKGSKVIYGKNTANRFECSNIRFKNVFGGEGPLNFVPASISSQCSAQSDVDFDGVREKAVMEIAGEIVQLLKKDGKFSAVSQN